MAKTNCRAKSASASTDTGLELTEEILHENGLDLDKDGFDKAMNEQRERARNARAENQRRCAGSLGHRGRIEAHG